MSALAAVVEYDEQVKWNDLLDVDLSGIKDADKIEFYAELIDIAIFGIQQQEGLEKLWMN